MNCPTCLNVPLRRAHRKGVEIDFCPQCRGVWLDAGELEKIIALSMMDVAYPSEPSSTVNTQTTMGPIHSQTPPPPQPYQQAPQQEYYPQHNQAPPRPPQPQPRDEDYRDRRHKKDKYDRYDDPHYRKKKKKGWLDEVFDIFD